MRAMFGCRTQKIRFLNNERTDSYVTCEKNASDKVVRQIVRSCNECDICASDKEVWLEQQSQRT